MLDAILATGKVENVFDLQDARVAGEHPADRDYPDRHIQEPVQRGPATDRDLAATTQPDQDNRGAAAWLIPTPEQAQQDPACDAEVKDRPVASIGGYDNLEYIPEGNETEEPFVRGRRTACPIQIHRRCSGRCPVNGLFTAEYGKISCAISALGTRAASRSRKACSLGVSAAASVIPMPLRKST